MLWWQIKAVVFLTACIVIYCQTWWYLGWCKTFAILVGGLMDSRDLPDSFCCFFFLSVFFFKLVCLWTGTGLILSFRDYDQISSLWPIRHCNSLIYSCLALTTTLLLQINKLVLKVQNLFECHIRFFWAWHLFCEENKTEQDLALSR